MKKLRIKKWLALGIIFMTILYAMCPSALAAKKSNRRYIIFSKCAPGKCIDVVDGNVNSQANVHLWDYVQAPNQQWYMTVDKEGYYSFQAVHSGKYLDVQGGANEPGTNVWQYDGNNTNAQKWIVTYTRNGYCTIQSKLGTFLDVRSGASNNGTNIQTYTGNGTDAQQWKIVEVNEFQLQLGYTYSIRSRVNSNMCLDVSGGAYSTGNSVNVHLWTFCNGENQLWMLKKLTDGCYSVQAYHSSKMLDVSGGSGQSGANIQQYQSNSTAAQHWKIIQSENDGYYYIISEVSNHALDLKNASAKDGQNIQQYNRNGSNAQQWEIVKDKKISSKALDFEAQTGRFIKYEVYNFNKYALEQIEGIISKKSSAAGLLSSLFSVLPSDFTYISTIPSVPRELSQLLRTGKIRSANWEANDTKYSVYAYKIEKYWNMYMVEERGKSANITIGLFVNAID